MQKWAVTGLRLGNLQELGNGNWRWKDVVCCREYIHTCTYIPMKLVLVQRTGIEEAGWNSEWGVVGRIVDLGLRIELDRHVIGQASSD